MSQLSPFAVPDDDGSVQPSHALHYHGFLSHGEFNPMPLSRHPS